jgi:hypothetical protein
MSERFLAALLATMPGWKTAALERAVKTARWIINLKREHIMT